MYNNILDKYKFKNNYITYEELITSVFKYLSENPFQDHYYIANKVGSRPNIIKQVIEDGIIRIIKQFKEENNIDIKFSYLCKTYGVKISYIDSLIVQGRIIIKDDSNSVDFDEIRQKEKDARRKQHLNNLKEISDALSSNTTSNDIPTYKTKGAFYSFNHDIRKR